AHAWMSTVSLHDALPILLVEGGAGVAGEFHRSGLVDRYVVYVAPAVFGGSDANGLFGGAGAWDISELWRGRFTSVERIGEDLRIDRKSTRLNSSHVKISY